MDPLSFSPYRDSRLALRCVRSIRNSSTDEALWSWGGRDYRKSHRDRWAKSCSADDSAARCIALHLAVGNARRKDDDGAVWEGIGRTWSAAYKIQKAECRFQGAVRCIVWPFCNSSRLRVRPREKLAAKIAVRNVTKNIMTFDALSEIRADSLHLLEGYRTTKYNNYNGFAVQSLLSIFLLLSLSFPLFFRKRQITKIVLMQLS